ncbi:MAG: DUF362 domain-containing protein [Candidatus Latescibacterota bacterium]
MIGRVLLAATVLAATPVLPEEFAVSVVPSDDASLPRPTPRDQELTADQVLGMVRRAVDLVGGMASVVPDTARLVAIKPNIVEDRPSGSGVVTDARVVRAVALLVHEAAPRARLRIAEGSGGWACAAYRDCTWVPEWVEWADGFQTAGHRQVVEELRGRGLDIDCLDPNFDQSRAVQVPGGGLARDEYDVAATILDADAWINCPVAKTHGAKITCCMKNPIGVLPGRLYGWGKDGGTREHAGIPHSPPIIDEFLVDLWLVSQVDLNVVDLIAGTEGGAFEGRPRRANTVVAGRNPVATDLVVARLMGFNPDDLEFADLAWQRGLGPGRLDRVEVRGAAPGALAARYRKAGADYSNEWGEQASFGMGPRRWTLRGPLPRDHAFVGGELARLAPEPGGDGWSPLVWFGHDRIDLDTYFDDPTRCALYAATRFTMPRADSVRFWLGSDEDLQVWIDGREIYRYEGHRRHRLGTDRVPGHLSAGTHLVLVRAAQTAGGCEFPFNVCEPIDDPLYAGNTCPGLRHLGTPGDPVPGAAQVRVPAADAQEDWVVPFHEGALQAADPVEASRQAPDSLWLPAPEVRPGLDLLSAAAELAGVDAAALDSLTRRCLSTPPFGFAYVRYRGWWPGYGPATGRVLSWAGLRSDVRTGLLRRESVKAVQGWLARGRVPLVGFGNGNWYPVPGCRRAAGTVQFGAASQDSVHWWTLTEDWWAPLPNGRWHDCPVVVVEPAGPPLAADALVDSVACLALEMGLQEWVEDDPEAWGSPLFPAGLAAWDAWTLDWERLPFTGQWLAADQEARHYLRQLGQEWSALRVSRARLLAAEFLDAAARGTDGGERQRGLREAASGYRRAAEALQDLGERLQRWERRGTEGETEDALEELAGARPLARRARAGERQALAALAHLLGRPELPPAAEDPFRRRELGRRLFAWRAALHHGVEELTFEQGSVRPQHLGGKPPEEVSCQVLGAVPREGGWQVAVEVLAGPGNYLVLQQPGPGNGWVPVVRVDNSRTRDQATELVVWAVPAEAAQAR